MLVRLLKIFSTWSAKVSRKNLRLAAKMCNLRNPRIYKFGNGQAKRFWVIKAAKSSSWSYGQTEGRSNRLKLLKRQMYGRAKLDLLRLRFLHPRWWCAKSAEEPFFNWQNKLMPSARSGDLSVSGFLRCCEGRQLVSENAVLPDRQPQ